MYSFYIKQNRGIEGRADRQGKRMRPGKNLASLILRQYFDHLFIQQVVLCFIYGK